MREPSQYLVLLAPAVTFLLALSNRQARISTIARENSKTIYELADKSPGDHRLSCLVRQNRLLYLRYRIIQIALAVLCMGLLILGSHAFREYFRGEWWLFGSGIVVMGIGTLAIIWEIIRAADTIAHEVSYSEWIANGRKQDGSAPPEFRRHAVLSTFRDFIAEFRPKQL